MHVLITILNKWNQQTIARQPIKQHCQLCGTQITQYLTFVNVMLDADAVINNSSQKVGGSGPRKTHRICAPANICSCSSMLLCRTTWTTVAMPVLIDVRMTTRAFQFGRKSFDSIRFDSRYRIDFFDSIRFGNLINLPLVHWYSNSKLLVIFIVCIA